MSSLTTRLQMVKPDPNPTTGDFVDVSVLDANFDKVDANVGAVPCTASTRPASPWSGMLIRETDTRRVLVWNATQNTWDAVNGALISASGSRPSTPGSGIFIRETDTRRVYIWNATEGVWDLVADPLLQATEVGAWTAYTPTWTAATTNPTLGNGTVVGRSRTIGKTMDVWIKLTWGSTTSATGAGGWRFTLPAAVQPDQLLAVYVDDNSASARWTGQARLLGPSSGDNMRIVTSFNQAALGGNTNPMTWATSDVMILQGSVELA